MSKDIKQFIRESEALFWGVRPEEKENISMNVLVETILNYGNEERVKTLFDLLGVKTVAEIFFRQISGKRSPANTTFFPPIFQKTCTMTF
jgi:hypothetical protein